MPEIERLLELIDAYKQAVGIGDVTLSYKLFGDRKKSRLFAEALISPSGGIAARFNGWLRIGQTTRFGLPVFNGS